MINTYRQPARLFITGGKELISAEGTTQWVNEVTKQSQACYATFTFGLRHRWTYFPRTLPDIAELLEPLERVINEVLIPAVTDHTVTEAKRDLLGLPVRMGDLGFTDPVSNLIF